MENIKSVKRNAREALARLAKASPQEALGKVVEAALSESALPPEMLDASLALMACEALEAGADPSADASLASWRMSPLGAAATEGLPLLAMALIGAGADLEEAAEAQGPWERPLARASDAAHWPGSGAERVGLALVAAGADVGEPVGMRGQSLAMVAAGKALPDLLSAAIAAGCSPTRRGDDGRGALDCFLAGLRRDEAAVKRCWEILSPWALDPSVVGDEELSRLAEAAGRLSADEALARAGVPAALRAIAEARALACQADGAPPARGSLRM